jgi:hypothetical protein
VDRGVPGYRDHQLAAGLRLSGCDFLHGASVAGAAALAASLLPAAPGRTAVKPRPNLIFFLGEGARWDESSLAGNELLKTPHIDRIGRDGAVFENAFSSIRSACQLAPRY